MKFKKWLKTYFVEFFTERYEDSDNPDKGSSWSKEELHELFKSLNQKVNDEDNQGFGCPF